MSGFNDNIKTFNEKVKGIVIATLTTVAEDGTPHNRPMATQEADAEGNLWFFTDTNATKVNEIQKHAKASVSFVSTSDNRYVSAYGNAELVQDRQKVKDLWQPILKAWFPNGPDDPNVSLIKINVTDAEYWEGPSGIVGRIAALTSSIVSGKPHQGQTDEKIDLK